MSEAAIPDGSEAIVRPYEISMNQPAPFPLPFQRTIYNSKMARNMDPNEVEAIIAAGKIVGLDLLGMYKHGYLDLGPRNTRAIRRIANAFTIINKWNLPIPPSPFIEYIVDRTSGDSKQDFSVIIDGKKGSGKSRTTLGIGGRYAIEMSRRIGGGPTDYFTLDNCALLEDTEAIARIMSNAKKYQFIMLDDASVAIGSRDFAQQKNKNFNKLLTTCRTRRWVVALNVPMASHVDLQVRELIDAKINVYKSFHAGGFNLLKVFSSDIQFRLNKKHTYEKRFSFSGKKFDLWGAFSIGILGGCYKDYDEKYDKQRDEAGQRLIQQTAESEHEMADPRGKREKKWDDMKEEYIPVIRNCLTKESDEYINPKNGEPYIRRLERKTGLNQAQIYKLLVEIRTEDGEGEKRKK